MESTTDRLQCNLRLAMKEHNQARFEKKKELSMSY